MIHPPGPHRLDDHQQKTECACEAQGKAQTIPEKSQHALSISLARHSVNLGSRGAVAVGEGFGEGGLYAAGG